MPTVHTHRGAKRARTARDELGLGQDGPVGDLLAIVEADGPEVVLVELPDDVAGAYVPIDEMSLIFVSLGEFISRQRFTLAHEFGHFRIGHSGSVDTSVQLWDRDANAEEVEANAFAAEFLVPKQAIRTWAEERDGESVCLDDVAVLAWEYGVGCQMIRYRLATCGVITDDALGKRLDGEIAERLHYDVADRLGLTPVEDSLSAEAARGARVPVAVRGSLIGDVLVGELDAVGMAERIGESPEDVRRMLINLGFDRLLPEAL